MLSSSWSTEQTEKYKKIVNTIIPNKIGRFCSKIDDNNILDLIRSLDFQYYDDFWDLIDIYKVYKRISFCKIKEALGLKNVCLRNILERAHLVEHFDCELADEIKGSPDNATLLIENYLEKHDDRWKPLHFPKSLTKEDKTKLVNEYISSDLPNINELELLSHSQSSNDLQLTDLMVYNAKKKYEKKIESFFNENNGLKMSVAVSLSPDIQETKIEFNDLGLSITYSLPWITENLDFPTVLNNFIYLFEYTDTFFRCNLVSKTNQLGIFESLIGRKGIKEYIVGVAFKQLDSLSLLQIVQYENVLKDNGVELLEVFKWFFEEYLAIEFNAVGFEFYIPSQNTTYMEKCKLLATSIDRILKQFNMYVETGNIDHELLSISSNPTLFKDVKSFIKDKYIYPCDSELKYVFNSVLSSQSILRFGRKGGADYDSFCVFIENVDVTLEEYDMNRPLLEKLIFQNYLVINEQGYIKPNKIKLSIVKDLYNNEVSCLSYLEKYVKIIEEMKSDKQIEFGSTLFSIPEQHYLNYLFNRAEFSNGLDLRNKYVHGSHAPASEEAQHRTNYYVFLRTLAFIIIKINEEFCLKDDMDKNMI